MLTVGREINTTGTTDTAITVRGRLDVMPQLSNEWREGMPG